MPQFLRPCSLILLCGLMLSSLTVGAEDSTKVIELTPVDRQFLQQQRTRIDDLARLRLGRQLNGDPGTAISILQSLLDRRAVRSDQTLELQAMGVVLGDALARELSLHWVVVEDSYGRSRALQLDRTQNFLFPVTMISRRIEAGATTPVQTIYDKAKAIMEPLRPPLPFQ